MHGYCLSVIQEATLRKGRTHACWTMSSKNLENRRDNMDQRGLHMFAEHLTKRPLEIPSLHEVVVY